MRIVITGNLSEGHVYEAEGGGTSQGSSITAFLGADVALWHSGWADRPAKLSLQGWLQGVFYSSPCPQRLRTAPLHLQGLRGLSRLWES